MQKALLFKNQQLVLLPTFSIVNLSAVIVNSTCVGATHSLSTSRKWPSGHTLDTTGFNFSDKYDASYSLLSESVFFLSSDDSIWIIASLTCPHCLNVTWNKTQKLILMAAD